MGMNHCVCYLLRCKYNWVILFPDFLSSSSNPLLEFCLNGGNLKAFNQVDLKKEVEDPLLQACLDFTKSQSTTDLKGLLCQTACDINVRDANGNTALHLLLKGKLKCDFLQCHLDFSINFFS
jgi:hypothetical protein